MEMDGESFTSVTAFPQQRRRRSGAKYAFRWFPTDGSGMKRCLAESLNAGLIVFLSSLQFQSHLKGLIIFIGIIPLVFMRLTKRPLVASKEHNVFTQGKKTTVQIELYSNWIKAQFHPEALTILCGALLINYMKIRRQTSISLISKW